MAIERPVFYFDFNSPYAYLASLRIGELIPGAEWKPFGYAILLAQAGRLEEAMSADPAAVLEIVQARAAERGLPPIAPPPPWPFESWSLAPLRAAVVAQDQDALVEFSAAAFHKQFAEGRPLADVETVRAAASDAGLDPDAIEEGIGRPEIKQRLKDNTQEAIARGVSGIPTVAVGDELFWGDDRLDEAAAAAAG